MACKWAHIYLLNWLCVHIWLDWFLLIACFIHSFLVFFSLSLILFGNSIEMPASMPVCINDYYISFIFIPFGEMMMIMMMMWRDWLYAFIQENYMLLKRYDGILSNLSNHGWITLRACAPIKFTILNFDLFSVCFFSSSVALRNANFQFSVCVCRCIELTFHFNSNGKHNHGKLQREDVSGMVVYCVCIFYLFNATNIISCLTVESHHQWMNGLDTKM